MTDEVLRRTQYVLPKVHLKSPNFGGEAQMSAGLMAAWLTTTGRSSYVPSTTVLCLAITPCIKRQNFQTTLRNIPSLSHSETETECCKHLMLDTIVRALVSQRLRGGEMTCHLLGSRENCAHGTYP